GRRPSRTRARIRRKQRGRRRVDSPLTPVSYVGRFAPSPTGPLHAGSLLTAVASFLHARQADGEWLVRIEDIDPPREVPGAADEILRTLEAFDLHWDRSVLRQSTRVDAYAAACRDLVEQGLAFRCRCSRSRLRAFADAHEGPVGYPGTCRALRVSDDDSAVDRKSTRLNSSHVKISYAVFCLKKKNYKYFI